MEIYNVYRERCNLHHNIRRNSPSHHYAQHNLTPPEDNDEALDLSRRCDSVETRKTPSPYATGSSVGTDSPSPTNAMQCASPTNSKTSSTTAIISSSMSPYPIYYPPIKRESSSPLINETTTNLSQHFLDSNQTNLINSIDLIKPISLMAEKFTKKQHTDQISEDVFNRSIKSPPISDDAVGNSLLLSSSSSSSSGVPLIYPKILMNDGKPTRPFKAFPRDPLVIAANFAATDVLYDGPRVERYTEYRKRVLEQIRSANGGQRTVTNPKMRRANSRNGNNNRNTSEEFSTKASNNNEIQANSSESEDRCTESSDNDASSSTPTTTNNGGSNNNNNNSITPNQNGVLKDAAYYERRRKNNAAAKKSRDRRRIKEDEIAIRAAYLERQNIELLCQLDALKAQLAQFTKSC